MIDCHLHLHHEGRGPDDTLAHIRGLGCAAACILPLESFDRPDGYQMRTEAVLLLHQKAPDLVIPFCCVDPRAADALRRLQIYAAAGCRGFGELKVSLPVDDDRSRAVFRLCGELGLPVTLHLEEGRYNTDVLRLERVLEMHPETVFVGHGQSFWAYLEPRPEPVAGYPAGPIEEPGPTMRWLVDYPNLYGDLSAGSGLNALVRDEDFTREWLLGKAWKKLLFATDCPCRDGCGRGWHQGCFGRRLLAAIMRLAPTEQAARAVLNDNAARLFGLA